MPVKNASQEEFLTPPEAARLIRVDPIKIIRAIRRGELKAPDVAEPGSTRPRYRIPRGEFQRWLESRLPCATLKTRRQRRKTRAKVYNLADFK
jgi:excisionase family DNA binding protein